MRCEEEGCKKKLEFDPVQCEKCEKCYCGKHRLPFEHNCDREKIMEEHKQKIIKQNPVVMCEKVIKI